MLRWRKYCTFAFRLVTTMGIILTKEIRNTIESNGPNKLYMVQDFAHLNNDGLVTRALSRLEKEGVLIRLSQGIYLYPSRNKFGILRPSIEEIAYAVAEKDKARIIPSGLTALNKLGLSTQVTMNAVYLTDAAARELTIGNRKIIFKRSVPRNFAYKTELFPLIVAAMKELGKGNVGINLDPANLVMYGKANPVDALEVFGEYVMGIHGKDGKYPTDGHMLGDEVPLGQGKVNYPAFVAKLKEIGYAGDITIEREISGEEQKKDIVMAKAVLDELLK